MAKIIKELTLDVMRDNSGSTVSAKQNDVDSRFIKARLTADRRAIEINPLSTAVINVYRTDGQSNGFIGSVNSDGTVTVPVTSWMLAECGTVKCDISVFDGTEKLTTMPFYINVEESLYDGEGIENQEEYGILSSLMSEVQGIKTEESLRVEKETVRVEAEEERVFSEGVRENAETVRETNEAERMRIEVLREKSEDARTRAEESRYNAEAEREQNEQSRIVAEDLRKAAEAERLISDSVRTTFVPTVSQSGILSWTNDKGLTNPTPVSIIPVKGKDYWTETDKSEIICGVLNSLPIAEGGAF